MSEDETGLYVHVTQTPDLVSQNSITFPHPRQYVIILSPEKLTVHRRVS